MKDYTIEKYEKANFILNYQRKDNKIIINYADGKSLIKNYNHELEILLLEKMKQQVILSGKYDKIIQEKIQKNNKNIAAIIITIILMSIIWGITSSTISIIWGALEFLYLGYKILRKGYLNNIEKDIQKNKLFLQRELKFKSNVDKEMGVYTNLRADTNRLIKTLNKEKEKPTWGQDDMTSFPTINDIDKFSYEAIIGLDDLIERNEFLNVKKLVKTKTEYSSSRRLKEHDH